MIPKSQGGLAHAPPTEGSIALDLLRKIANRVPGVVYQFRLRPDGSSCFPFANEATRELFRVSPEEIREDASKVFANCHPDDLAALMESIRISAQNLTPWYHEVRSKFDDGTVRWLFGNALPQGETDGSVLWHGFITDITERKIAEEQLRIAAIAFESQDGMIVTDSEGVILRVNQAFTRITGYSPADAIGQTPAMLQSGRQNRDFYARMWATLRQNKFWQGEIWNKRKNGDIYVEWLNISAVSAPDGNVTHYVGAFSDITRRKHVEQESIRLLHRNQMLMDTSIDGIHVMDINGNVLEANDAFCHMLGYTQEEIMRLNVADWDAKWTADESRLAFKETIGKSIVVETLHRRKDGILIDVEISVSGSRIDGRDYIFASSRDITERKANERQLHELAAHIQTVREEEKTRIAREIHDELGSALTALKMEAYRLAGKLSGDKHAPLLEHVESMTQLIDSAVSVTRRVITDLRPTILDDLGLMAALEWQCEEFQKRTRIACKITGAGRKDDESKLDKTQAINLFRIYQEALTNVSQHSGATNVEVEFNQGDEEIILSVSDNGRGMPEGYIVRQNSYGMRGMCERVAQLGGQIRFDSPPGGGFRITAILPLATTQNNEGAA